MKNKLIEKTKNFNVKKVSPFTWIAISFVGLILLGSLLLSLPIANKASTSYLNHLFISTSASCVTGLVTLCVKEQYTLFGQIIILILIQIGGLGFLTLLMVLLNYMDQNLSLNNRVIIQNALNIKTLQNIGNYLKRVMKYTILFEGIGWVLLTLCFLRYFDLGTSIWYGFFHSISAFCNAGFDLLGSSSLIGYKYDVGINLVVCFLIIAGGLGFVVHMDLEDKFHYIKEKKDYRMFFKKLALHTKIVLIMTALLIFGGMFGFLLLEFNNTLASESFGHSLLLSFFQSVTLRTAGFSTMDYAPLKDATKLFMSIFMLIGGSPAGTAGGVKTVTIAVIVNSMISNLRGSSDNIILNHRISDDDYKVSVSLLTISIFVLIISTIAISLVQNNSFIDLVFEIFSAMGTVGITTGVTGTLCSVGKIIIICLMYMGRIGPVTLLLNFIKKQKQVSSNIRYSEGQVIVS